MEQIMHWALAGIKKPFKVYAKNPEDGALRQFGEAMRQERVVRGALMADAHQGYSLPIGGVVAVRDAVCPAYVGFDIGCGVCAMDTGIPAEELEPHRWEILEAIKKVIPTGTARQPAPVENFHLREYSHSSFLGDLFMSDGALFQMGTMGGGNHFCEIGRDDAHGDTWIVVHSGSRHFGYSVGQHYMRVASGTSKAKEGHFFLDVQSEAGQSYLQDVGVCVDFAYWNRLEMISQIYKVLDPHGRGIKDCLDGGFDFPFVNKSHNHVVKNEEGLWVHRKGAADSSKGTLAAIPGNMRDGTYIVRGLGNPDSLASSSHGAGRVLGRAQAKRTLSVDAFREEMKGIAGVVGEGTLDEAPGAYKDIQEVMSLQSDLVEVVGHISPFINLKASKWGAR